jgi:glutamate dehydrogenase (NAD(P)+)
MTKRQQEISNRRFIEMVEQAPWRRFSPSERELLIEGPHEIDFVRTALEETLTIAYHNIHDAWKQRSLPDLRTAAFYFAIKKVAGSYLDQGIFP